MLTMYGKNVLSHYTLYKQAIKNDPLANSNVKCR